MSTSDADNTVASATGKPMAFRVEGVGGNDKMPYTKADFVKACRVGEAYAVSFYQMDYQAAVNAGIAAEAAGHEGEVVTQAIPVMKVVFDADGFGRFMDELQRISAKIGTPKQ